ncbi:hypothetical protein BH23BAC1_BH23BAC1_19600 [soil metagenome]
MVKYFSNQTTQYDVFYHTILIAIFQLPFIFSFAQGTKNQNSQKEGPSRDLEMVWLDTYAVPNRVLAGGAAEIPAYDPKSNHVFITNGQNNTLDIIKISENGQFSFIKSIDLSPYGIGPNSVAFKNGLGVIVVDGAGNQDGTYNPGNAIFFDAFGNISKVVGVGYIPDMVVFTPNGQYALVANEAEPNAAYTFDPEGSISIIDVKDFSVRTADFKKFNDNIDPAVRIFGPGATVAQDLEPEYIAVTHDSKTAFVSLQENNAIAVLDIKNANITNIFALGAKDHSNWANALDASDRDGSVNITTWPIKGFYMPDAIATFSYQGKNFIVTANEGDSRDYDGYSEETRVNSLNLDPLAFPNAGFLKQNSNLDRLKVTTANGDANNDGLYEEIYSFGARSFSIFSEDGTLIYDSKNDFENITADLFPAYFNSNHTESPSFDSRSDDKGPEPEGITLGRIGSKTYAFIGLERIGGIMAYDITNPFAPEFKNYINNRNFDAVYNANNSAGFLEAKDLGPEGLIFIPSHESPTKTNLLVLTNEVSGTTSLFEVVVGNPGKGKSSQKAKISTYPNPVVDKLFVKLENIDENEITIELICGFSGKVHYSKVYNMMNSNEIEIPSDHLSSQLYFLKIKGNAIDEMFRMIKK